MTGKKNKTHTQQIYNIWSSMILFLLFLFASFYIFFEKKILFGVLFIYNMIMVCKYQKIHIRIGGIR